MYRAKVLLRGSELSLMEIAGRVGYETDTALSRAFRRFEGIAPGEWRRSGRPTRSATERRAQRPRRATPTAMMRQRKAGERIPASARPPATVIPREAEGCSRARPTRSRRLLRPPRTRRRGTGNICTRRTAKRHTASRVWGCSAGRYRRPTSRACSTRRSSRRRDRRRPRRRRPARGISRPPRRTGLGPRREGRTTRGARTSRHPRTARGPAAARAPRRQPLATAASELRRPFPASALPFRPGRRTPRAGRRVQEDDGGSSWLVSPRPG